MDSYVVILVWSVIGAVVTAVALTQARAGWQSLSEVPVSLAYGLEPGRDSPRAFARERGMTMPMTGRVARCRTSAAWSTDAHAALTDWPESHAFADVGNRTSRSGWRDASLIDDDFGIGACMHLSSECIDVNPATGLPMLNDAFDVMGNIYGFDHMH